MVEEILKVGQENALSGEYLASVLGFKSVRDLQNQIKKERDKGAVIVSSTSPPGGYYLPGNKTEVVEFIQTLESRAENTMVALNSAKAYLAILEE